MNDEQNKGLPLVSIVITSYNRETYIAEAIDSALSQDYPNLEIVISDNCSTDNTDAIINKYLGDKRIRYFRNQSNIGMTGNFKAGTERARGEYLAYLSSDDYFINDSYISGCVALINKYSNILLVLSRTKGLHMATQKINDDNVYHNEFLKGDELFLSYPRMKTLSFAGTLLHRETLLRNRPFDKPCTTLDVLSMLNLMLFGNVAFLNVPSYMVRVHDNNAALAINIQQAIDNFIYITEPYDTALKNNIIPKEKLDEWKLDSAFIYARYISVQFAPQSKKDYNTFIRYVQDHFPGVLEKLKLNFKWNILIFFFKRPAFSLKFFNLFSEDHFIYLKRLIKSGNNGLSEKIKL